MSDLKPPIDAPATELEHCTSVQVAVAKLVDLYSAAKAQMKARFDAYVQSGTLPDTSGAPVYPYLCVVVPPERTPQISKLALGDVAAMSVHGTDVTHPEIYGRYITTQLERVVEEFDAKVFVGKSLTPIRSPSRSKKPLRSLRQICVGTCSSFFIRPI